LPILERIRSHTLRPPAIIHETGPHKQKKGLIRDRRWILAPGRRPDPAGRNFSARRILPLDSSLGTVYNSADKPYLEKSHVGRNA